MPEVPQAVLLHDLHLSRATEEVAVLSALYAWTHGGAKRPTLMQVADSAMYGYLAHAFCRGSVVHPEKWTEASDLKGRNRLREAFSSSLDRTDGRFGQAPVPVSPVDEDPWRLNFVISPVDGARALLEGIEGGSVSVLVGGPPRSFIDEADVSTRYLVLALSPELTRNGPLIERLKKEGARASSVHVANLVIPLVTALGERRDGRILSIAVCTNKDDYAARQIYPLLHGDNVGDHPGDGAKSTAKQSRAARKLHTRLRCRAFRGSSVSACLQVFLSKTGLDAFVGVVRSHHAIQIATAARALDAEVIAVPIASDGTAKTTHDPEPIEAYTDSTKPVLGATDFVPMGDTKQEPFMVVTGISDSLLLRGVTRTPDGRFDTHTLCLRARTKISRFIQGRHDLKLKLLRFHGLAINETVTAYLNELKGWGLIHESNIVKVGAPHPRERREGDPRRNPNRRARRPGVAEA